ncbi:MAG: calcineurin-like phosphoesterase family protein [Paramuribaculum sp.]|nr:calcineurin-like phosphoesterase family protein [Paramuribaculum sp.]
MSNHLPKFIQNAFFFVFLLATPAANGEHRSPDSETKRMNLTGRVTVDGKPREGVVVSDGISVVTTDSSGVYQMSSEGRQHVFISVPSDCEIPVEEGFPKFYTTISENGDEVGRHDFALISSPVKKRWSLMTIADPQIGVQDTADYANVVIPQICRFASTLGPNTYGISLGDLIWNSPGLYPEYKKQSSKIGIPLFSVIGNHDHNEKIHNDSESDRDFRNSVGPTYYSVNIGDCHLVALDDVIYSGKRNRNDYTGGLTRQQLDWLRQDLAHVDTSKTIIVGVHIPTSRRNAPGKIQGHEELYELLRPFHRAEIFSGHTHYHFTTTIAPNITETTYGAAMGAFWYPMCNDGSPRGFGVVTFDGSEIVDKFYTGSDTPRKYQMKLYRPEEAVLWNPENKAGDPYDKILINIFCWHTDWTVEVSEDGRPFAPLSADARLVPSESGGRCWDPEIRKCLVKGKIPANHGGSKPADKNDHMFLYTPCEGWSTITVRATDPYGNVYTETLDKDK